MGHEDIYLKEKTKMIFKMQSIYAQFFVLAYHMSFGAFTLFCSSYSEHFSPQVILLAFWSKTGKLAQAPEHKLLSRVTRTAYNFSYEYIRFPNCWDLS